jgi:hypothetical protein
MHVGIPLGGAAPTMQNALDKMKQGYRFFTIPGDMEMLGLGVNNYFGYNNNSMMYFRY